MNKFLTFFGAFAATLSSSHAVILWTGTADTDIFNDANWDFSGSGVATIASNVSIADNVTITNGTVTIPDEAGQVRFQIGNGFTLTVDNSSIIPDNNDGIGGEPAGTGININLVNGANFNPFFIVNGVALNIDGTSSAILGGGGNPVNLSTINLTAGATLGFVNETPAAYTAEHLSKTTVDGAPAADGVNIAITPFNGANGSMITVIPEPSGIAFLGLAGLALTLRRRR